MKFDNPYAWLGKRFLNITFSIQVDDPTVDIEEIRDLLGGDTKENLL